MIEMVIIWFVLSIVAGAIAENKGRSGLGFFALSVLLSPPLLGIISAVVAKSDERRIEEKKLGSGDYKKCPHCAELVRAEARKCRYCGAELGMPTEAEPMAYLSGRRLGKAFGESLQGRKEGCFM